MVGGFLLIGAALVAVLWANSPWSDAYESVRSFSFGPEALHLNLSVQAWAADGLLTLFFFIVGNELKQEFVHGELRHPRRALLPIVAALCGVVLPAAIFAAINFGQGEAARGWGIPMATDIAFAVAVLAVVGRHLPPALRTFLLTLAIVDDLAAIVVIAVFYTEGLSWVPLLGAVGLLAVFGLLQRGTGVAARLLGSRVPNWAVLVPLAVVIWALMHASGVHATIAGAAMGLLMRTRTRPGESTDPSYRAEHQLRPWVMGLALPVFALFSAGVVFGDLGSTLTDPVSLGIVAGLVGGKLIGIAGGSWLATKLTPAELNPTLRWIDIVGMSQLAGIGFTVSLLISELSFPDPVMLDHAKSAVIIASVLATALAAIILGLRSAHYRAQADRDRLVSPAERS
ncbi:Na+/H+ antiporter NhaA [Saccharopolyspora terrae]|uniref:Na(+)/H(+) antiporter NhaA n=1 Tax=Saccharopolyspora terrae TaxID=2530384 RepID=A0A4R4VG80_9PSEU|nr:Na+/H+ antiporter NhaA [Saccharopolyspora terrae]TDD01035.1 Na+/H+ antiporter NhaA [Saccharopolyspora terrae]